MQTALSICLNNKFPVVLFVGPKLRVIYNLGYEPCLGKKITHAMGEPSNETWKEIWDIIGPLLYGVMESGEGIFKEDQLLVMDRRGQPEETYWTFSYSPIKTPGIRIMNELDII